MGQTREIREGERVTYFLLHGTKTAVEWNRAGRCGVRSGHTGTIHPAPHTVAVTIATNWEAWCAHMVTQYNRGTQYEYGTDLHDLIQQYLQFRHICGGTVQCLSSNLLGFIL